jgi:hypothetical protein
MKDYLDAATIDAISSREGIAPIYFLWIKARNRSNGAFETMGLWSGWDAINAEVLDPDTRLPVTRPYQAGGSIVGWPNIPLETGLVVRNVRIRLSQINEAVQSAIRGYDAKHAPVEMHQGFCDPHTMLPVSAAIPVFIGRVNGAPFTTPAVGDEGGIELVGVSDTRELTRLNPLKRSDEMQRRRVVGGVPDRFRRYSDVAGGWLQNIHWGEAKSK